MTTDQRSSPGSATSGPGRGPGARPASGHPGLLGGSGDLARDGLGDLLVEHARDDVLGAELAPADAGGDGARGGQLHLVVDEARPDVEQPAEEAGEAQHVVDLVRVVTASGGHYPRVAERLLRLYLRHRIRHGEDDPVPRHAAEVAEAQGTRHG